MRIYIYNKVVVRWAKVLLAFCLLTVMPYSALAQVTWERVDSITVTRLLQQAPNHGETLWMARQFLGRPYVAHTLEVNDREQLVVNTRQLDCTTLVETVMALTLCKQEGKTSFDDFVRVLQQLRYRGGVCTDYTSRLHYFSDWINDKVKMQLVRDIQGPNPPFSAVQKLNINYMSTHPTAYKALKAHPELVPVIRRQEQALTGKQYRYIPKSALVDSPLLRQTVSNGDIIAITCNKAGLDIAHLGFAVWRKDGLHLLNASLLHKKVVEEPKTLYQYMQEHPSFTGIRIIRINR